MRLIYRIAGIVGAFMLIPEKSKAIAFALFVAILFGVSFLVLGMIVAFFRVSDKVRERLGSGGSREHKGN